MQGEGGFYVAPPDFLRALRALCDRHGIVLIADEIQTGLRPHRARCSRSSMPGVEPDLMTVAKSIAGGVPLSGVIGKAEIMDAPPPGGLGGTYAGSPLGCAAALAVLDVIDEREAAGARAAQLGERLRTRLHALAAALPRASARCAGLGAMVAMELVHERRAASARRGTDRALVQAAARRGLVILLLRRLRQRDPLPRAADDSGRSCWMRDWTSSRRR